MRAYNDELIEQALSYGSCQYSIELYKNDVLLDIDHDKVKVYFIGSKIPVGCVTRHYMTFTTSYGDIAKDDKITLKLTAYGTTLTIGEFYVTDFDKRTDTKSYTAYSSKVDLSVVLDEMVSENEAETIDDIVNYYLEKNGISFQSSFTPSNMKFYVTSIAGITLLDLLSDYGKVHMCNFIQEGNTLKAVALGGNHSEVTYDKSEVVYSNNFAEYSEEKTLDYVNIKYTEFFYEEDEKTYVCQEANIMAKRNDAPVDGIDIDFALIPYSKTDVSNLAARYAKSMVDNPYNLNDYTVKFLGDPRPEVGDIVNVKCGDVIKPIRAGKIEWNWDGGLTCIASTGPDNASTGKGVSLQQMENTLRRVSTDLLTVKYNAVYTNELYAKVAQVGFLTTEEFNVASEKIEESLTQIKKQLNNELEAYIGDPRPTATNYPANEWTEEQKIQNVGTKYYCSDGTSWQWMYDELSHSDCAISHSGNTLTHYYWMQLSDSAVGEALANANDALKQIGDLSTKLIRDYYTKTETDASFKATNEGIESLAKRTTIAETNIESIDGRFANYVDTKTYESGLEQTAEGFKQYAEKNYTTKTEFGNMKIGGENLILNSLNFMGLSHFIYSAKLAHNNVQLTHKSINLVH